jgi:hypothetical protein
LGWWAQWAEGNPGLEKAIFFCSVLFCLRQGSTPPPTTMAGLQHHAKHQCLFLFCVLILLPLPTCDTLFGPPSPHPQSETFFFLVVLGLELPLEPLHHTSLFFFFFQRRRGLATLSRLVLNSWTQVTLTSASIPRASANLTHAFRVLEHPDYRLGHRTSSPYPSQTATAFPP